MSKLLLFMGRFFYLLAFICASHANRTKEISTPRELITGALKRNRSVARVRRGLIRSGVMGDPLNAPHPSILVVACMDGRIQMHTLFGDPRLNLDALRMPGSVTTELAMVEAISLAIIAHNVKVVFILDHTDCAMLKVANDDQHPLHGHFRCLVNSVHSDDSLFLERFREHNREAYERFARGEVIIARGMLDTSDGEIRDVVEFAALSEEEEPERKVANS